jgi:predicted RNA polymerase sigma factor
MPAKSPSPVIPIPRDWSSHVRSAVLHTVALAQFTLVHAQSWAANNTNHRLQNLADVDQARQEIALLNEQIRILNIRMEVIPPSSRPIYPPTERLAILELKAARGWSLDKTAKAFLVTPATIASLDEKAL